VIVAAGIILLTGWVYADPLISVLIGLLVLATSWKLLRDSVGILLEEAPRGINAEAIGQKMVELKGVEEVHDLHVWTITSGFPALAAHVLVGREENCHERRRELEKVLYREFGIEHTTLQVDHAGDHAARGRACSSWRASRGETQVVAKYESPPALLERTNASAYWSGKGRP
jgi:cobalt-zinc-cadmium efflux system protein